MSSNWIIYTDLDGTLLDFETYTYAVTAPLIHELNMRQIPVVFCSSKTRREQEVYRQALAVHHPFVVENGSAVFIPRHYFTISPAAWPVHTVAGHYRVVELGVAASSVRKAIEEIRAALGLEIFGYADLSTEAICRLTGLSAEAAQRAASREYSETLLQGDMQSAKFAAFQQCLEEAGLQCVSGGKFYTVMGRGSDKGKAVRLLNDLYRQQYQAIATIGLGDSANDMPMLAAVDHAFLVQQPNGQWQAADNPHIRTVEAIGPQGWNEAVRQLVLA